jgi:hypothetical protein
MVSPGRLGQLIAQLADEHVDDLEFGLLHPAVEVVEEHLLRQGRALAQTKQFEDLVFPTGELHRLVIDRHDPIIEVYFYFARSDRRSDRFWVCAFERFGIVHRLPPTGSRSWRWTFKKFNQIKRKPLLLMPFLDLGN